MGKKIYLFFPVVLFLGILIGHSLRRIPVTTLPLILQPTPVPTPLAVYSFENLKEEVFSPVRITLGRMLSETESVRSQVFTFTFSPRPGDSEQKTVSGAIHLPKKPGVYPVIVQLRGYVPPETYTIGAGTNPSARVFAEQGFITLAPDFLGFGESDERSSDQYESRFQTYTTALTLLSSLSTFNASLDASYSGQMRADIQHVGLWGHSNGGHIALATLAITGQPYPTVLWAPVSKSFPFTNLFYTDEDDDQGKAYRKDLARFEQTYDTDLFSPPLYYRWISAPVQIHQGTTDEEVPFWWSEELVQTLRQNGLSVEYIAHPGADHNLRPAWSETVKESVQFFKKSLQF